MPLDIHNLDLKNYGIWPRTIKIAVTILLCLVLFIFGYWADTKNQLATLRVIQNQEKDVKAQFARKQLLANNLIAYQQQMTELHQIFENLVLILPGQTEIAGLLEEISKLGVANGLEFQLVQPQPVEDHGFYAALPIKIQVTGNFNQFAKFVSDIANLPRIVTLGDFAISLGDSEDKTAKTTHPTSSHSRLIMNITAKTYWYTGKNKTTSGSQT